MKKKNIIISVIGIALIIAVVLIGFIIFSGNGKKSKKSELSGLTKDNLLTLSLESRNKENSDEDILVEIDFKENLLKTGKRSDLCIMKMRCQRN